jgi:hypothetical protein
MVNDVVATRNEANTTSITRTNERRERVTKTKGKVPKPRRRHEAIYYRSWRSNEVDWESIVLCGASVNINTNCLKAETSMLLYSGNGMNRGLPAHYLGGGRGFWAGSFQVAVLCVA